MPGNLPPISKRPEKLAPVWRALVEVCFIVFLYYSNLLMGKFEGSGQGRVRGLFWALKDILTEFNFTIAIATALIGYLVAAASVIRASMTSYTRLFAQQHAAQGIRMNCVAPNVVFDNDSGQVREDLRRELPIQRPAFFREVADVVAFLLSAEASYVSGETMRVDAGASRAV
jgi:NAD(P)-dependent dehydrogenase (short-subunit alcohol dehydrogenase family)